MSKSQAKLGYNDRGVIINRTTSNIPHGRLSMGGGMGSYSASSRMSMGGGISLPPGSASQVTSEHIQGVKDRNQMEKKAFQECNMKLAKKVEKEKFLTAQNKILLQELENLRGKKNLDRTPIEEECLQELEAYKQKVADNIHDKAEAASKVATLQDEAGDVKRLNDTLEQNIQERIKQIERLNTQMGDMEGENSTLRRTVGSHEDEIKRLKAIIAELKQNLDDARTNLDEECRERIEAELNGSLACDQRDFTISILEKEIEELKKLLNTDTSSFDIKNLWKGEITSCIKQLQEDNDKELCRIKADYAARYDAQMRQMGTSQMKDNAIVAKLESEISRLKGRNVDQGPQIAQLNAELQRLRNENERLREEMENAEESWHKEKCDYQEQLDSLNAQMAALLERFRELQDDKLTLETEITTYRRLLENEEEGMDRFVTQSSGARSPGADKLNDLVQSSSRGGYFSQNTSSSMTMSGGGFGGSSGFSSSSGFSGGSGFGGGSGFEEGGQMQMSSSGMGGGQMSSSEGKVFIKKKASGPLCIDEAKGNGALVTLAFGSKEKKPGAPMNLEGWKVLRFMEGETEPCCAHEFKDELIMQPAAKLKIFGSNFAKDANARNGDIVSNSVKTWKSGGGKFALIDKSQTEKGFLMIEFR
ncbi:retrograde protein of 51 kDa-like isoform X2 [Argopecten irradians]|uniref:retrograde protein of 51 kDa-like isoform X2 n=1 Tax=Argopecten irradians TaxID=31199 RepID=UPI00371764B6